jgi:TetR/AcrR family transcriptional regulator, repressor of fatR-cypB operon
MPVFDRPGRVGAHPEREREILDAALDLFVERGYEATSVPEVAKRAGVAAGTIYLYFESKEVLVNALLARIKRDLAKRVLAAHRPKDGLEAQFRALHGAFGRYALEFPRAGAFCDLHHHAGYVTAQTLAVFEPARRAVDAHLREGRKTGRYRDLPVPALRALFIGPLVGLAKFARMGELTLTPALVEEAASAAWAGLARLRAGRGSDESRPSRTRESRA